MSNGKKIKKEFVKNKEERPAISFGGEALKTVKVVKGERRVQFVSPKELKEGKKISIMFDPMFKTMFANSERIDNPAKFLSYHVDATYEELLDSLQLINTELDKDNVMSKGERADFVATIRDANINVEVNNNPDIETLYRNIDFAYRLYSKNIEVGSEYKFTPTLQINLNNFKFEGIDDVETTFYLRDEKGNILNPNLAFKNISIPNLLDKLYNEGKELLNEGERYVLVLAETDVEKAKEIGEGYEFMQELINKQVEYGKKTEVFEAYDKEWAARSESYNEGHDSGFEEGKNIGVEEGQAILIKKMLSKGKALEEISDLLDISIEEINSLIKE